MSPDDANLNVWYQTDLFLPSPAVMMMMTMMPLEDKKEEGGK